MVCAWCFAFFRPLGGLLVTLARYYPLDMDHSGGSLHGAVTCCRRRPGGARRERGVRACGRRATGHGARAGAVLHWRTFASAWYPPKWVGLSAPSSRARRGSSAAIGQGARTIGSGRSWARVGAPQRA